MSIPHRTDGDSLAPGNDWMVAVARSALRRMVRSIHRRMEGGRDFRAWPNGQAPTIAGWNGIASHQTPVWVLLRWIEVTYGREAALGYAAYAMAELCPMLTLTVLRMEPEGLRPIAVQLRMGTHAAAADPGKARPALDIAVQMYAQESRATPPGRPRANPIPRQALCALVAEGIAALGLPALPEARQGRWLSVFSVAAMLTRMADENEGVLWHDTAPACKRRLGERDERQIERIWTDQGRSLKKLDEEGRQDTMPAFITTLHSARRSLVARHVTEFAETPALQIRLTEQGAVADLEVPAAELEAEILWPPRISRKPRGVSREKDRAQHATARRKQGRG